MKLLSRVAAIAVGLTAACGACVYGCASSADILFEAPYTEIFVDPSTFLFGITTDGGVPPRCGAGEGSLVTYVATLHDVTFDPAVVGEGPGNAVYDIPSSQPTRCALDAAFGQVIYGHLYTGEIDGYTQDLCAPDAGPGTDCVTPLGSLNSGARTMVDGDGNAVAPTWHTSCGVSSDREVDGGIASGATPGGPTVAGFELEVKLLGCGGLERVVPLPTTDGGSNDGATLVVQSAPLVAPIGCDADGGVGKLQGTVRQTGETRTATITASGGNCAASNDLVFTNVTGSTSYDVDVVAFVAGSGQPSLGTTCSGTAIASAGVSAQCSPLSTEASIAIDTNAVVAAAGLTCADVGDVSVTLLGLGSRTVTGACGADLLVSNLAAGIYQFTAELFAPGDTTMTPKATVSCHATVSAGAYVTATCG